MQNLNDILITGTLVNNQAHRLGHPIEAGADPGFSFRGAQKIMCAHAHHKREAQSPLRPGSRACKRALEALGFFFCALSCYLSLSFKHSDTKWGKKHS